MVDLSSKMGGREIRRVARNDVRIGVPVTGRASRGKELELVVLDAA
jgi:hypothetical protein